MTTNASRIRPVSSIEEVRASVIDFDGSLFFFPDMAGNRIYTKQINLDGTASLNMYELKEIPTAVNVESSSFVSKDEFEKTIANLGTEIESLKGMLNNAQQQST